MNSTHHRNKGLFISSCWMLLPEGPKLPSPIGRCLASVPGLLASTQDHWWACSAQHWRVTPASQLPLGGLELLSSMAGSHSNSPATQSCFHPFHSPPTKLPPCYYPSKSPLPGNLNPHSPCGSRNLFSFSFNSLNCSSNVSLYPFFFPFGLNVYKLRALHIKITKKSPTINDLSCLKHWHDDSQRDTWKPLQTPTVCTCWNHLPACQCLGINNSFCFLFSFPNLMGMSLIGGIRTRTPLARESGKCGFSVSSSWWYQKSTGRLE